MQGIKRTCFARDRLLRINKMIRYIYIHIHVHARLAKQLIHYFILVDIVQLYLIFLVFKFVVMQKTSVGAVNSFYALAPASLLLCCSAWVVLKCQRLNTSQFDLV